MSHSPRPSEQMVALPAACIHWDRHCHFSWRISFSPVGLKDWPPCRGMTSSHGSLVHGFTGSRGTGSRVTRGLVHGPQSGLVQRSLVHRGIWFTVHWFTGMTSDYLGPGSRFCGSQRGRIQDCWFTPCVFWRIWQEICRWDESPDSSSQSSGT